LKIKKSLLILIFTFLLPSNALADNLLIKSFGHSNFLIKGDGKSIILNPYKSVGCASNLNNARFSEADFILASSRLADEGYNPSNLLMFVDPGSYKYDEFILNGIHIPHDRFEGRRFGMATVWTWEQSNLKIVHMTGAAGKINIYHKILLSKPDITATPETNGSAPRVRPATTGVSTNSSNIIEARVNPRALNITGLQFT